MKKPLYSPWEFEFTKSYDGFCLLPQVILYTQVPVNQKSSVDAGEIFLCVLKLSRQVTGYTEKNEAFYEDRAVWKNVSMPCCSLVMSQSPHPD